VSILEYGAAGATSPSVEYVRGHDYGGGVGGLEYSVRGGTAAFNFYDSRGDVTTQTDATGGVTYQAAYEAFGNQTATSGSTLDRQKANTKELAPTGLLNEGFRYRDPDTGTFLTRDPLGFKAGPNMYTYVHQNPWTHFDPEGLDNFPKPQPIPNATSSAGIPLPSTSKTPMILADAHAPSGSQPNAPTTKKGTQDSSNTPNSTLDVPPLTFDMQSHDQHVANDAKDFGLNPTGFGMPTSPSTSAQNPSPSATSGAILPVTPRPFGPDDRPQWEGGHWQYNLRGNPYGIGSNEPYVWIPDHARLRSLIFGEPVNYS
jgi:RHS repeat-associated protein